MTGSSRSRRRIPGGITASHDPVTGTLTLTGSAPAATYAALIASSRYHNTKVVPNSADRLITVAVTDDDANSVLRTTTVHVVPLNGLRLDLDRPGGNDSTTVGEDSGVTLIFVLTNDTDVDGGPIAVRSVTQPANGTVSNNGTDVSYTPNANYCNNPPGTSPDTFTYTLTPGGSTATVSVTVTCAADPPRDDAVRSRRARLHGERPGHAVDPA